jgi:RNA polymerase sigma-70 factor (ECF subfamily)
MGLARKQIEELYDRRYVGFRNALAGVTGSYESARDVVQEAFAEALRHRRGFRGDGSPEAWIWKIALRIALHERARSRREAGGTDEPLPGGAELPGTDSDPQLAAALRALPPRRRLMVFLRYFADLSYDEIAVLCDVSPGTVAATLAQARDALRAALETNDEVLR